MMAVGRKEKNRILIKDRFLFRKEKLRRRAESIAPDWIATSNSFKKSVSGKLRSLEVRIKCIVEDIGKNSVMPSIVPKRIAM